MTLNLTRPAISRWPALFDSVNGLAEDWSTMLEAFQRELKNESAMMHGAVKYAGWLIRAFMRAAHPGSELLAELYGAADYLGVPRSTALAAQFVYDASTAARLDAQCGCTSFAMRYKSAPVHGRNLDWGWPSEIAGRVWHIDVVGPPHRLQSGQPYTMEHIPGSVGFTAAWQRGLVASLNQAPTGCGMRATKMPSLLWFRQMWESAAWRRLATGEQQAPPAPGMTSALIHLTTPSETVRIGYDKNHADVERSKLSGNPVVMANAFDPYECEDSLYRYAAIKTHAKKGMNPEGLLKSTTWDMTIHSVLINPATGKAVCV